MNYKKDHKASVDEGLYNYLSNDPKQRAYAKGYATMTPYSNVLYNVYPGDGFTNYKSVSYNESPYFNYLGVDAPVIQSQPMSTHNLKSRRTSESMINDRDMTYVPRQLNLPRQYIPPQMGSYNDRVSRSANVGLVRGN